MTTEKKLLIVPIMALLLMGCGDGSGAGELVKVQLDNVELCLEKQYVSGVFPQMTPDISSELDESYNTIRVVFEPEELKNTIDTYEPDSKIVNGKKHFTSRSVILSSKSAVTGFSHAGQLLVPIPISFD